MSLIDRFYRVADFREQVSVVKKRSAGQTSFVVERAAAFQGDFSSTDGNGETPPRVSIVWRLQLTDATRTIRRGDRIFDGDSQEWIVVETSISSSLDLISCRCVCEQLFPDAGEYVDIYRLESLNNTNATVWNANATPIATNVPAIARKRELVKERVSTAPLSKVVEEISLWVRASISIQTADVLVFPNGAKYETFAYRPPTAISDWGILDARQTGGDGGAWKIPS